MSNSLISIKNKISNSITKEQKERFLVEAKKALSGAVGSSANISIISKGTRGITQSDQDKFSNEVLNCVTSKEFTGQLVDTVGLPKSEESKAEYLARAKGDFMRLLGKKLEK